MKRTFRIDTNINSEVKVGDKVKLTNDETLTHMNYDGSFDLLRKYPVLGINQPLEDLVGEVIVTGITEFAVERDGKYVTYLQDIIVKVEGQNFRTTSGAVRVIRTPEEVIENRIQKLYDSKKTLKKGCSPLSDLQRYGLIDDKINYLEDLLNEIKNSK